MATQRANVSDHPSDKELLSMVRRHDSEAMRIIYEKYCKLIMWYCRRSISDAESAEDIWHEVLAILWEQPNKIKTLVPWMIGVADKKCKEHKRKQATDRRKLKVYLDTRSQIVQDTTHSSDIRIDIDEQLNPSLQKILNAIAEGKTFREIAAESGDPRSTIWDHLQVARETMRALYLIVAIAILKPTMCGLKSVWGRLDLIKPMAITCTFVILQVMSPQYDTYEIIRIHKPVKFHQLGGRLVGSEKDWIDVTDLDEKLIPTQLQFEQDSDRNVEKCKISASVNSVVITARTRTQGMFGAGSNFNGTLLITCLAPKAYRPSLAPGIAFEVIGSVQMSSLKGEKDRTKAAFNASIDAANARIDQLLDEH